MTTYTVFHADARMSEIKIVAVTRGDNHDAAILVHDLTTPTARNRCSRPASPPMTRDATLVGY